MNKMPVSWTKEQLDAINAKNKAVIVSAAAGSGKTAVLVEKLLRLLSDRENPVSADTVAVVTFTNDAAAQMKQRLSSALAAAAELDPENEWLAAQQALIPSAKISTIHSFCFNLIRENAGSLDIDSSFRILDSAEDDVISQKAAENVFEIRFEQSPDDMKRLTDFFCPGAKNAKSLSDIISELRENILALPFPKNYMERIADRYKNPPEAGDDRLIALYTEHAVKMIKKAARLEEECLELALETYGSQGGEIAKIKKNLELLGTECAAVTDIADRISADPRLLFSGKISFCFEKITFYGSGTLKTADGAKTECEFDRALLENAKTKRDSAKKIFAEDLNEFTYEDIRSDYIVHGEICEKLFGLLSDISDEEQRLKSEKNALGFSDAEQLACSLLCRMLPDGSIEKTALAKELSDYFSIVMIDEFQDSTAVQELIFRMISRDGSADIPGRNFFAVGDVKQSIYRFRCADPRIFLNNLANSVPYSEETEKPSYILLNRNFRSSYHVVEFVNAVFGAVMSPENGGADYGENERLIMGADCPDDFGPTEIIDLPPADGADGEDGSCDADLTEARCTAARIRELLDTCMISGKDGSRPVRPSDICILMRSTKTAPLFISCLEELGIPASGAAEESFLGSREISVLINLLRCIDNPTLDIPLAAVLMSPMFMFSAEDMARIRLIKSSSLYGDITAAASEDSGISVALSRQCMDFLDIFGELREFAAAHSVEELIGFIYDKTDFLSVVGIYKDSLKKKANLRLLPVYAADYDKNGTGGLSGFIRRINSMLDSSKDFAAASAAVSNEDSVSVKTIHKSKGLEYPFVFLCRSQSKFNLTDTNKKTVFVSDYGAAFRICDSMRLTSYESFPRRVLSLIMEKNQRDEEMMLLYVALTRAKNKLFITRQNDEKSVKRREYILSLQDTCGRQEYAAGEARSMADWLDAALGLFKRNGNEGSFGSCKVIFTEGKPCDTSSEVKKSVSPPCSEERGRLLRQLIAGSESYDLTLSDTASKLTVSEIAEKPYIPSDRIFIPSSEKVYRPKGVSAAAAGTAVHGFMQYADLKGLYSCPGSRLEKAVRDEAKRLCGIGRLTKAQAECVDHRLIENFLRSDICGRMLDSGEIYREKKFLVKISDLNLDDTDLMVYNNTEGMLQGVADCVFGENGKYILLDYKTDRRVTAEILAQRYSRQLSLYAAALSLILDSPVSEAYLYSFSLSTAVEIRL